MVLTVAGQWGYEHLLEEDLGPLPASQPHVQKKRGGGDSKEARSDHSAPRTSTIYL